ncbi:eukaryotic translation initiation factor 5B-like [Iris pallida]|uniref:Eukaryotic translation initiation factor 5B-like n=1 Tax=Iris pallida TaxID=29817 RepID=A0AAX6I5A6_IRIPA|nr:eukaryotic translation initiation factor 5B-like [Iris pallida]KAJ6848171.1 eukaryotic translation initiation factor 5B-like [Iris pallida]
MEEKTKEELEAEISKAMLARISDFKEEADKLTLEGVRRALEKDLGLKKLSLDAHKKFIKQCLDKFYYGAEDIPKTEEKVAEEPLLSEKEETSRECDDFQPAADLKNSSSDVNEITKGSPALVGEKNSDHESEKESLDPEDDTDISEDAIKKAIRKRAAYLRSNLQITLVKVRRLLEEDLKLEKNSLDAYKKFIGSEVDEILQSSETVEATNGDKKEHNKASNNKSTGKTNRGAKKASKDSDSSDSKDVISEDEESDEEVRRPKKRPAQKIKTKASKKQKTSTEKKTSASGKKKPVEPDLEKSDESDDEKSPEGNHSESSSEEEDKKRSDKPTQVYGKKVEHLKSIIKSCGMGIPPSVYKRAKQAPENKREAFLIKELEEILEREGLSTNPSEKDIKSVKKKKERAKELEGIDMSNIVTSSRRRTTSNYIPPPKPKVESESDEDEENEDEDDDNNEDSDDGDSEVGHASEGSDEEDAEEESD